MVASRERTFEVARRVHAVAKGLAPKGEFETATMNAVTITLFWRAISLFDSIVLLAKHQHVDEGLILARSLFEDSLVAYQLSVATTERPALVFGWLKKSLNEKEGLVKEAHRVGLEGGQTSAATEFDRQRAQIQEFASKHGVTRAKTFLTPKDAATKCGRNSDYWTYYLAHEFVHGSDAAAVFRRRKNPSGIFVFHGRTGDAKLTASLVAFASRSLIQLSRAVAALMKWDDKGELDKVEIAVNALES